MADTIYAHSSGAPPAAVAVIRISGPDAHDAAQRLCGALPDPRRAGLRELRDAEGLVLDQALVLRFDAPASATGEDLVELHCHGGRAVVDAILTALSVTRELRLAEPGEFTRRALMNGRLDLTEAEGLADLLAAQTELQRRAAISSAGGALRRQVEAWRSHLIDLCAQAEAAIDYVGDELETATDLHQLHADAHRLASEWMSWLAQPRVDLLHQGVRAVLAGPPNAGKSSLLNALTGEDRAIVTEVAGTTRDVIEVAMALEGVPFLLVDTAGLRESAERIEQMGIGRAREQVAGADILLWLGSQHEMPKHPRAILVHSQSDRRGRAPEGSLAVSSVSGEGLPGLKGEMLRLGRQLVPGDASVSLNRRQANALAEAAEVLGAAPVDLLLLAEALRHARSALDRISGRAGLDDVLDALFSRFCLGK